MRCNYMIDITHVHLLSNYQLTTECSWQLIQLYLVQKFVYLSIVQVTNEIFLMCLIMGR